MPRFNRLGQFTRGYAASWFDDGRTLRNDHGAEIRLSDETLLASRPCSLAYANGRGDWAAFYSPPGGPSVVFGPGFELPGAGLTLDSTCDPIGPDGTFVYKKLLNSFGPWGFLNGTHSDFGGDCQQVQNLGGGRVLWLEDGVLRGRGVDVPAVRCNWARWIDGHLLLQAEDGSLVLDGHVIAPPSPLYYRPDLHVEADGSFVVVWARDEGETDIPEPLLLTAAALAAAPLYGASRPQPVPTFRFAHPVLVAPFKDHEGGSGAPAEIIVNQCAQSLARPYFVAEDSLEGPFRGERLGVYTERADLTALFAKFPRTRLLVGHDDVTDWNLTALRLRPFDIPMLELYFPRVRGVETVAQSVARWFRQATDLLRQWPGDCALAPQFYCMGGGPPDELYSVDEVRAGLAHLCDLANLSPRFKLILPFAFLRANGVTAHHELRIDLTALLAAADVPGRPVLLPVPVAPPPPPTPPPAPPGFYKLASRYEVAMTKRVALRLGQFFASVDPNDKYPDGALKGWCRVRFKKDSKKTDAACAFQLSTPRAGDPRLLIRPESVPAGALSIDATEFSGDIAAQFSIKPNVSEADWGGYEAQHGWALGRDGIDIVLVEYDRDGQKYASACLTVVEL